MRPMPQVIVAGYIVRYPLAGNVLASLQYVLGFERLGCRTYFLEEHGPWPNSCFDPLAGRMSDDPHYGLGVLARVMEAHGLGDRWVYVDERRRCHGLDQRALGGLFAGADALVNVSGVNWLPEFAACPRRVFIDTDPGFTQFRLAGRSPADDWAHVRDHDLHFSYALNLGGADCAVPAVGLTWRPTRPPIVLGLWPVAAAPEGAAYTTVMNWQAYEPVTYDGVTYGQKDREFERFMDLPRRTPARLRVAVAGGPTPRDRLTAHGWEVEDAVARSLGVEDYQGFIRASRGEFTIAKHGYVAARTGWFGDRSASYLASGKPVVMQDTGFGTRLPLGDGLLAVGSVEEAVAALARVEADYAAHARGARAVAESCFASNAVLAEILEAAGIA